MALTLVRDDRKSSEQKPSPWIGNPEIKGITLFLPGGSKGDWGCEILNVILTKIHDFHFLCESLFSSCVSNKLTTPKQGKRDMSKRKVPEKVKVLKSIIEVRLCGV